MNNREQFDFEENELIEQYNDGKISKQQFNNEMRILRRTYQEQSEEAAEQAYRDEKDRW